MIPLRLLSVLLALWLMPLLQVAAAAQSAEELPEYLRALGYLDWDEGADLSKRGVVHFEPERASPGYNLYTNDEDTVFLDNLAGERVHQWKVPRDAFRKPPRQCEHAELLRSGLLAVVCVKQGIAFLDWSSRAMFAARGFFHHDVVELSDGRLLAPARTKEVSLHEREVAFDGLMLFSLKGEAEEVWSSHERRSELKQHHPPLPLDMPLAAGETSDKLHDYYHLNAVQPLPDTPLGRRDRRFRAGNWLVSLRNASLVVILDQETREIVWSYGPGVLELQHTPRMLASGNILIFDNGTHRGYTRVLEIAPESKEIVWQYRGKPPSSFFSKWRGNAQRLPNGNTLITESERGHVFEITKAGETVWDFWNPEVEDDDEKRKRKRIYRMSRLPVASIEPLLAPR